MSTSVSVTPKSSANRVSVTAKSNPPVKKAVNVKPTVTKKSANESDDSKAIQTKEKVVLEAKVKDLDAKAEPKKRRRPRIRPFSEIHAQISEDCNVSYKRLQSVVRSLKSLESAHTRELNSSKTRTSSTRTPTIVFDEALVSYFRDRLLSHGLLNVTRKQGDTEVTVDLSDLSSETRVHRTDATQLYTKAFRQHNMLNPEDKRFINYQGDKDLVNLLTTGDYKPELEEDVQKIRDGTLELTIFNIQRYGSHHISKAPLAEKTEKTEKAE